MSAFCSGTTQEGHACSQRVSQVGQRCGRCQGSKKGQRRSWLRKGSDADATAAAEDQPFAQQTQRCASPSCRHGQSAGQILATDGQQTVRLCPGCGTDALNGHLPGFRTSPRPPGTFEPGDAVELTDGASGTFVGWVLRGQVCEVDIGGDVQPVHQTRVAHPYQHHPRWNPCVQTMHDEIVGTAPVGAADEIVNEVAAATGNEQGTVLALAMGHAETLASGPETVRNVSQTNELASASAF